MLPLKYEIILTSFTFVIYNFEYYGNIINFHTYYTDVFQHPNTSPRQVLNCYHKRINHITYVFVHLTQTT